MPTLDQKIATGFNRNHRTNAEGGIVPEEFRVEYVADRVETTVDVWLGLTAGLRPLPRPQVRSLTQKISTGSSPSSTTFRKKGWSTTSAMTSPTSKRPLRNSRSSWRNGCEDRNGGTALASLEPKLEKPQTRWRRNGSKDERCGLEHQRRTVFHQDSGPAEKVSGCERKRPFAICRPTAAHGERASSTANGFVEARQRGSPISNIWTRSRLPPGLSRRAGWAPSCRMPRTTSKVRSRLYSSWTASCGFT